MGDKGGEGCDERGEEKVEVSFGGRIKLFTHNWRKITSNPVSIDMVKGVKLELDDIPTQCARIRQYKFDSITHDLINTEINTFVDRGIVEKSSPEEGEIISPLFCRKKKSGKIRMIGNFADINKFIVYHKFKQDTIKLVLNLIRPNCFMTSIDLTDAYFCVNVHCDSRKFLKFYWNSQLYQFTSLPQGIGCSPRIFTKIMKIPLSWLREQGITLSAYIDDIIIISDTLDDCNKDTKATIQLLQDLGYVVNFDKSSLTPSQNIEHLGLIIDSKHMTVRIGKDKIANVKQKCVNILNNKSVVIRDVASLLGTMVAYTPGVEYGLLHYRNLERNKIKALRDNAGNFDAFMSLDKGAVEDIEWWKDEINNQKTVLVKPSPLIFMSTDSSKKMWGAVRGDQKAGGSWNENEQKEHINILEMKAILFGLKSLCADCHNTHVRIKTDSSTCVCYLNARGGSKSEKCDILAKEIWSWCIDKNIFISAEHIAGILNTEADFLSRNLQDNAEWSLKIDVFNAIMSHFKFVPTIDLFATRVNTKVSRFIAWRPDPEALAIDTFSQQFQDENFYAFPPFNMIHVFLRKVELENLTGIIIVPNWSTQPFFPLLLRLLIDLPVRIK